MAAHSDEGFRVSIAASAHVQEAATARSVAVSLPTVDALLGDLPTAHRALPIGHRVAGQGCHGAKVGHGYHAVARLRFVYFPSVDGDDCRAVSHPHLTLAEILLDRVLAARAAGLRPMAPALDYAAEARATVRPPRSMFHPATLEYRRWYRTNGSARTQPLTREALALRLAATDELSMKEARARVAKRSHALSAADQAWLVDRRHTPLERRPLNQAEFRLLVRALDVVWEVSAGSSHMDRANRRIALRAVAVLGNLLDEYVASPFQSAALSETFNEYHLAHLRRTIEHSRLAESASCVLLTGPKAWFAAKSARMRAEHQIGLARSSAEAPSLRLSGRPMIAMVGRRLCTFVDGRRPGARSTTETPAPNWAAFG